MRDCKRRFPTTLCLGGSLEAIWRLLRGHGSVEKLSLMDSSYDMVMFGKEAEPNFANDGIETSFLLALKLDGLFQPAIFGGKTLKMVILEACTMAQIEREGGLSPRLSPLAQVNIKECIFVLIKENEPYKATTRPVMFNVAEWHRNRDQVPLQFSALLKDLYIHLGYGFHSIYLLL
ncbi:hypothetical protein GIB67_007158 [Kingdonia uniflora]|uniref:Uncharacterized protein n=1 Tax=Kingdonia uniflora TaxID=39325 RepID=A0A7J7MLG9_9MAGN|nr:hypothetical protein GIB67_007158 [Kingdonia uniflora]